MISKTLLYPIFILRLLLLLFSFLIKLVFYPIHRHKSLIISLFLLLFYLIFNYKQILPKQNIEIEETYKLVELADPEQIVYFDNFSKIDLYEEKLLKINKLNPASRNVLINLSVINLYKNNLTEYHNYLNQAKKIDPNSPLLNY